MFALFEGDCPGLDHVVIPFDSLHQAPSTSRKVIDCFRPEQTERLKIDHIDIAQQTRLDSAAIFQPIRQRILPRQLVDQGFQRQALTYPVTGPVSENKCWHAGISYHSAVGTAIRKAIQHLRMSQVFACFIQVVFAVKTEWLVKQFAPILTCQQVVHRFPAIDSPLFSDTGHTFSPGRFVVWMLPKREDLGKQRTHGSNHWVL